MDTAREVHELVDERPELESGIRTVLDADEPFTFDDLDLDSGTFGEIAASTAVTKTDGGAYRVSDRDAVRRGLDGDFETASETGTELSLPAVDRRVVGALGGALLLVVVMRLVSWPAVFRDGVVVLSGNDPYFYRYWVEQLLVNPETSLGTLPSGVTKGEPLLVVTLWTITELFGGTRAAAGQVMAWYPVGSAVVGALLLYLLAVEVSDDRRVGLAAVALLAVVPGHAMRTSLGFADHHAFDYLWLALTALSLVVLAGATLRSRRTALGIVGVGVGVAGQTLAWDASPLLLAPVGLVVTVNSVLAVHRGEPPVTRVGPVLVGLAGGAAVVWVAHSALGWHTPLVATAPVLLVLGSVGVVAVAAGAHRVGPDVRIASGGVVGVAVATLALLAVVRPDYWNRLVNGVTDRLFREGVIAETQNLFGPSFGWLLLFGFVLVLAVPYLAWATWKALDDARWAVPVAYGWYLLVLATIQIRFVGELATFAALFAGLGIVHLAERVDVSRSPVPFDASVDGHSFAIPDRRQVGALVVLVLLVGGLGIVQVPVKTNQLTTPEELYETAAWMDGYSEERGWEHPQNYVFSAWSRNRIYNYFVSGESRSYTFAQRRYDQFLTSSEPTVWYEKLRDRAGFVVYAGESAPSGSVGTQLAAYGSRTENASGLDHYRAVHVSESGTYRVFTLVPGATIAGETEPNSTVTVTTGVSLDDRSFTYQRRVTAGADGRYRVTVPYTGAYTVGGETVQVSERAVTTGGNVTVG